MSKQESREETFVVLPKQATATSSTATVTLPDGARVHTLDRALFDRAVNAANNYVDLQIQGATVDVQIQEVTVDRGGQSGHGKP